MEITLAVVSDLHCHHSSTGFNETMLLTDADRLPETHHPVSSLLKLIQAESLSANILVMPGDLANRVDRQGIISGWGFVREIAGAIGAGVIAPTMGNHDVIWKTAVDDPFDTIRKLSPTFPAGSDAIFNQYWSNGFCFLEGDDYRILLINSAAHSTNDVSSRKGLVTPQHLTQIETALTQLPRKPFQIAVCHHHPLLHEDIGLGTSDVMENGGQLLDLLSAHHFDIVVHGHKHHPKLTTVSNANPLAVLAAGSFAASMRGGLASRTRNLFHMVHLFKDESALNAVKGTILTWQFQSTRGWRPATWESSDFPYSTGFGTYSTAGVLARKIETNFKSLNKAYAAWNELSSSLPELDFITPQVSIEIGNELKTLGLQLSPMPPEKTQYIGQIQ